MIALSFFNFRKVLDGARVALVPNFLDARPKARIEWCADHLIMSEVGRSDAARTEPDRMDAGGVSMLAIDPTNPDTAHFIDRRIAEAGETDAIAAAVLWVEDSGLRRARFRMSVLFASGMTHECWPPAVPLIGLDATPANLPEARRRLICALYPPA